jgi:hypothetical protein
LKGTNIQEANNPWEIQSLRFDVGWHNVLNYYDDVKVFEVSGPTPSGPVISSVTPIAATRLQTIYIYGSGFGNTPPQTVSVGDGSVDTVTSTTTPYMDICDRGKAQKTGDTSDGGENWAAGVTGPGVFCMVGIYLVSWSDNEIVLGGFGTALGTYGQGTWYIEAGDPLTVDVYTPEGHAAYTVTAEAELGSSSSVCIVSGSGVFSSVSATSLTVNVSPGQVLSGTVTLDAVNGWPGNCIIPLIGTPNWGTASSSWWLIDSWLPVGFCTRTANVQLTAPSTPGTYYLIFAFRAELTGNQVASGTNWAYGPDVWGDGNDIAEFSPAQISQAQQNGAALDNWLCVGGYQLLSVPASAITLVVGTPPAHYGITISGISTRGTSWWRDDGAGTIEIKEGQLMLMEATVTNTGDVVETFDLHVFYEDLETNPIKSFPLETFTLTLQPGVSTQADFVWNTRNDEPLTDSVHPHLYDLYATAHLPDADAIGVSSHIRVFPVILKNWLLAPQHENSPTTIKWEFPDNFIKDGSAAHNHRRNNPFYALCVWDNRFLTRDESIGLNWFDQGFDPVKPWLFYYGHGFISKDTPLRYYFVDISSWPVDACGDIRNAFEAWSNLNDPSKPELATGIFFQEVTSVTDANNPGKDAEILLHWQDLGNILEKGNNKGNPGGTNFAKLADGKWIANVYFNSRNPLGFDQPMGSLFYWYDTWYYGDPQLMPLGDHYEFPYAYHDYLPLYCTALHEIGHALGLTHLPEYYQSSQVREVMFNEETPGELGIDEIIGETRERALDLYSIPAPYCMVTIHSPAHLFVTDPLGRHIGFDSNTGSVVNDIPYGKISGFGVEPENATISWPLNGIYQIQLIGTATGDYTLTVEYITNTQTTTQTFKGTISPQEIKQYSVIIPEKVLPVGGYSFLIEGYTPAQPFTPYLALITILMAAFTIARRKTHRRTK